MTDSKSDMLEVTWSYTDEDDSGFWNITKTCYLDKYSAEKLLMELLVNEYTQIKKKHMIRDEATRVKIEKEMVDK